MKKFLKYVFLLAFVFGGWVLAASSLHVVRAPGADGWGYVTLQVRLVPKNTLTFTDTWVDLTKWNAGDLAAHQNVRERLVQAGKGEWLAEAAARPVPAAPTVVQPVAPVKTALPVKQDAPTKTDVAAKTDVPAKAAASESNQKPLGTTSGANAPKETRPTSIFDFGK